MKKIAIGKVVIAVGIVANASILFILPHSKSVVAAQGGYGDYGDYGAPPICTLESPINSVVINQGGAGFIAAKCSPKADEFKWDGSYFKESQSSGIVYPFRTSTYSVIGKNAEGDGNLAKVSIYVCGSGVSRSESLVNFKLVGSDPIEGRQEASGISYLFDGKNINSIIYDCNDSEFNLIKTNIGWRLVASAEGLDDISGQKGIFKPNLINEFNVGQNSGRVYRIYQAAFNREPDEAGLQYWIDSMNYRGLSLRDVSNGFIGSDEFKSLYGVSPSNEQFITKLYANVLHRLPDQGGYNYWLSLLSSGAIDKTDALIHFSESPENKVNVINKIMVTIDGLNQ